MLNSRRPFLDIVADQVKWSSETFSTGRRWKGVLDHIRKELVEIEATNGDDLEEWIDVLILAMDGAWRCAHAGRDGPVDIDDVSDDVVEMLRQKMAKNRTRTYPKPVDEDTAVEHIRD